MTLSLFSPLPNYFSPEHEIRKSLESHYGRGFLLHVRLFIWNNGPIFVQYKFHIKNGTFALTINQNNEELHNNDCDYVSLQSHFTHAYLENAASPRSTLHGVLGDHLLIFTEEY